jgi:hypothetical protein
MRLQAAHCSWSSMLLANCRAFTASRALKLAASATRSMRLCTQMKSTILKFGYEICTLHAPSLQLR